MEKFPNTFIEHEKPESNDDIESRMHELQLCLDGKEVGYARLQYFNKPFPFYYIGHIFVQEEHRDKKLGVHLLEQINDFLDKRRKAGVLRNGLHDKEGLENFYEKRRWEKIGSMNDGSLLLFYNTPEGVGDNEIKKLCSHFDRRIDRIMSKFKLTTKK
jgi:GNAT superfamily N-acetyltransferase